MSNFANDDPSAVGNDGLEIFEHWDLYERIIQGNWMCHRELRAAIQGNLSTGSDAIGVLDVGSGDGRMAYNGLEYSPVSKYVALDQSRAALENLQQRPTPGTTPAECEREVFCGDFAETIGAQLDATFDLVLCSYSLHHLSFEDKRVMLKEIKRVMAPHARLFWIDAFRREGETREQYLTRLAGYISEDWTTLSESEREDAVDHIWTSDFPETEQTMLKLLAETGLDAISNVWSDAFFGMWKASKTGSA